MADQKQSNPYDTVTLGDAPITSPDASKKIDNSPYNTVTFDNKVSNTPQASVTVTGAPADFLGPALGGAAVGAAAAKYGPQPYNLSPDFLKDQEALSGKIAAHSKTADLLNQVNTEHAATIDTAHQLHTDKLDALKNAEDILAQATEHAQQLDAIPPEGPGQKWIPTSAATGTPTGAAETTVSEAGQLSRLAANRPAGYNLTNAGIYVPGQGDVAPILTKEQEAAKAAALKNYLAAQQLRDQHQKIASQSASDLEKMRKATTPRASELQKSLDKLAIERAEIEQRLKSKTPSPNAVQRFLTEKVPYADKAMEALGEVNNFINKTPGLKYAAPALSAGLGVPQTLSGMQHYNEGQKLKGALEMLSGAGGVIGAVPHPATRAFGALSQLPYMGYEAGEYIHDKLFPPK